MEKIISAIFAFSAIVSCSVYYGDNSFGGYDDRGFEYIRYNNDIIEYCLNRPMTVKQYVDALYTVEDIKPANGSSYVFTDASGQRIGPMKCTISGNDTTWTYSDYSYVVNRTSGDGYDWEVSRKDKGDGNSRFRYDFTLKVKNLDDRVGTLKVSLSGYRYEDSDYYLSCATEDGFLMIPDASGSGGYTNLGTLCLDFYKDSRKLDWLRTTYLEGGSVQYESSFD